MKSTKAQVIIEYLIVLAAIIVVIAGGASAFHSGVSKGIKDLQNGIDQRTKAE